ncbi:MAG: serine hydrolase [Gemmatimonadetes bacterium]|nr:beta-lactamase family protein [Gemmatimonadota bacterium]NIR78009.1 beta-lactamase family protein [Gemmatimonadota bacterium]NIT86544.1 beta-lactamase family protein [Gemmatimonadota bacterium]NIU30406.1 beta-lactamase family protein [Gemmatimonadota bacterium]NIU35281.1 serine hydrolase [Gemmatimonadota bacterium]
MPPNPLAVAVLSVALLTGSAPAPDSVDTRLERRIPELMERAGIPGLSAALVKDGRVTWTGAFGVRSRETGDPVTDETVFQAASLSKPVFAYVALRLAERGVLDLDRPLHAYRPNPRMDHAPRTRRITARMVLSHTTGLPNWGGDTLELFFDPGTAFRYSGEGYVYLQSVVESLTGLGLAELARREVFGPLGMTRTGYVWEERFGGDATVGHDDEGEAGGLERPGEPNAAASLLTTAGDYARFLAAVLEGRGLGPRSRRATATPQISAGKGPFIGDASHPRIAWSLGWGLLRGGEAPSLWHWGDNGDFKAFVAGIPDGGTGVVYFANSSDGLAIAESLVREALGIDHPGPDWAGYEAYDDPRS